MSDVSDLLERYRRGTDVTSQAIEGASASEIDFRPAPGRWSIRQVVNHLADTEAVAVFRFRSIIAEDNPKMTPFNQDLWASRTDSETRELARALQIMRILREDNYELLMGLSQEAFSRICTHAQRGELTLLGLVEILTNHPERHAGQIRNNR